MRLAKNGKGKEITVQNLSDIFVKQQEKGALLGRTPFFSNKTIGLLCAAAAAACTAAG